MIRQSPLDRVLAVTRFYSETADAQLRIDCSLCDLAAIVRETTDKVKEALPWLKLARFGFEKTKKGSYRHDANVLHISGVEGDYDAERTQPETAAQTLKAAGIAALIYTSPSHTEDTPRWRVLCPLSKDTPPGERRALLGRLNGALGGVLASESFTLSQAYYFGSVKSNPSHKTILVDGRYLDEVEGEEVYPASGRGGGTCEPKRPDELAPPDAQTLIDLLLQLPNPADAKRTIYVDLGMAVQGCIRGLQALEKPSEGIAEAWADWASRWEGPSVKSFADELAKFHDDFGQRTEDLAGWWQLLGIAHRLGFDTAPYRETKFDELPPEPDEAECTAEPDDPIERLNLNYMVVNEGGKAMVYSPRKDPVLKRRFYDRSTFTDFKNLFMNQYVAFASASASGDIKRKPLGQAWLTSPKRRQYTRGIVFDPTGARTSGTLNLWEGLAVDPKPGDWSLLRDHVRDVICCGNLEHFEYLTGWMARLVQHPDQQGEVAVAMKGGEGTGKGTLARALIRIFGQHGSAISNPKHLVGNFNQHLRDCAFLFADEAFFAGDKQHVGVLKSIITEPHLTIEGKFQNAVQAPNYLHVMMACNEEWVVPASLDSRRFFVLEILDARKNDHAYFGAIWKQMESGGYEAMLHDLQQYDLTGFNVRRVPVTAALQEQRGRSLQGPIAWWADVLHRGYVGVGDHGWHDTLDTGSLYASYKIFAKEQNERRLLAENIFGRFMRKMALKPCRFGVERRPGYRLGTLAEARAQFFKATDLPIEWPEDDDDVAANDDRLAGLAA